MTARRIASSHAPAAPLRHARTQQGHPAARRVALGLTSVLVFGVSAAVALAGRLEGNVDRLDVTGLVAAPSGTRAPDPSDPNAGTAVNILLIGSDERTGAQNAAIGGASSSMASDTTIVAHLSADRTRVELVSIPRDSMVRIPSCTGTDGSTSKARANEQINAAFAIGWGLGGDTASAAGCVWSTVQENTGVLIDHVAVIDMAGFQAMIDAIDGVDICIPTEMTDGHTGLHVTAGMQHLDGDTAMKFARARYVEGTDGSDLNRIGNQQRLLSAVMTEVLAKNIVSDAPALLSFLSAATSSMATNEQLSLPTMVGLAYHARHLRSGDLTFMTIPNGPDPADRNRVVWTSDADRVWSNMAQDLPIVAAEEPAAAAPEVPAAGSAGAADPIAPGAPAPADPDAAAPPPAPAPAQTRVAGRESFTGADVTAVC